MARGKRIRELEVERKYKENKLTLLFHIQKSRNLPTLEARVKENGREFGMR
jgi:hypothetical protein